MKIAISILLIFLATSSPIFSFELTPEWSLLELTYGEETKIVPNDFEFETSERRYIVQTIPYSNKASAEKLKITVYPTYLLLEWKLIEGAHENFKTVKIYNEEHDEYTEIDVTNSGSVEILYHVGINDYDIYCYTGQTVGLIEFDLFDVLIVYVEEKIQNE